MISYQVGDLQFNFRVVAVVVHRNRVLVHQELGEEFWTLPGGRCELLEQTTDTLTREMQEELGTPAEVEGLLWVVENFYRREGRDWHEIALYHRVCLPADSPLLDLETPFPGVEEGTVLTFKWVPLSDLLALRLYPSFLADKLAQPSSHGIEHLVWHDLEERIIRRP